MRGLWLAAICEAPPVAGVLALLVQGAKDAAVTTTPLRIEVTMKAGLDRLIQRERTGHPCGEVPIMGCPAATPQGAVSVYLLRDDPKKIHAFIGDDPRNGCAPEWQTVTSRRSLFHDACHGSLYDRAGQVVGGPSPWNPNEIAVRTGGSDVYVDPATIVIGDCAGNTGYPCARAR